MNMKQCRNTAKRIETVSVCLWSKQNFYSLKVAAQAERMKNQSKFWVNKSNFFLTRVTAKSFNAQRSDFNGKTDLSCHFLFVFDWLVLKYRTFLLCDMMIATFCPYYFSYYIIWRRWDEAQHAAERVSCWPGWPAGAAQSPGRNTGEKEFRSAIFRYGDR